VLKGELLTATAARNNKKNSYLVIVGWLNNETIHARRGIWSHLGTNIIGEAADQ